MKIDDDSFFNVIRTAWKNGRPIVPIVGAGASADSGFPPLASVIRYIAKLSCYLTHKLYFPPSATESLFRTQVKRFADRPDQFISIFGWPDRFQLNSALRARIGEMNAKSSPKKEWASDPRSNSRGLMDVALSHALDGLAQKINPGGYWHLNEYLTKGVHAAIEVIESANTSKTMSRAQFKKLEELLAEPPDIQSFRYQVVGDWKPLLRHVTWYQPELVDALFARLARNRTPGTAHTLLAHISHLLRIRAIFTFNFDPFIETALAKENVPHRVFAMEHGTELPSRHHLDDSVSVIKMHGSTHNILVDERVDYRVSERYKQQFLSLIGESPLLLVIGCSGNDRRLVDLVGDVMSDVRQSATVWVHHSKRDDVPALLRDRPGLSYYSTYDLGQSLQRLFEELTERLPNSSAPYVAHINRPTLPNPLRPINLEYKVHSRPVSIFSALPRPAPEDFPSNRRDFLYALAEVPQGYTPVLVDLEEHHTLEQVVAEIIDQIRRADTALPPFVTSGGISEQHSGTAKARSYANKAADCVVSALRRSRYALCISGIDAFPFRPTTHHGVTREFGTEDRSKFKLLFQFLLRLTQQVASDWTLGDSFVVLAHEAAYSRHCREKDESRSRAALGRLLIKGLQDCADVRVDAKCPPKEDKERAALEDAEKRHAKSWNTSNPFYEPSAFHDPHREPNQVDVASFFIADNTRLQDKPSGALSLASTVTAILAFHRRTRTRIGIKHLLRDIYSRSIDVLRHTSNTGDLNVRLMMRLLETGRNPPWISWTQESALWLDRPARDWIYDFNTRFTTETELKIKEHRPLALLQSLLAAILHDRIARNYYLNQFLPSRDPFFFMEYVYHRISTLRYLAQLQAISQASNSLDIAVDANERYPIRADGPNFQGSGVIEFYADGSDWTDFFVAIAEDMQKFRNNARSRKQVLSQVVRDAIRAIRERCIKGLTETWVRSESHIRQALPPEQVVTWCENLLEYNLGVSEQAPSSGNENDRISAMHVSLIRGLFGSNSKENIQSLGELQQTEGAEKLNDCRRDLIDAIKNTLFRGMYAHASYLKIVDHPWLFSNGPIRNKGDKLHWELNRQVASLWAYASRGDTTSRGVDRDFRNLVRKIRTQSEKLRGNRSVWSEGSEARLRAFYLEAEAELAPSFADDGSFASLGLDVSQSDKDRKLKLEMLMKDRDKQIGITDDVINRLKDTVVKNIGGAIEEAREEYGSTGGKMRNPLLEPTADRGLFIPYRSLFQIQLGRTHLFIATLLSRRARLEIERARLQKELNGVLLDVSFKKAAGFMIEAREYLTVAYRDLAYAKHGIGTENSALLAISDLCCADVALAGSDHAVAWLYRKGWDHGELMVSRSQAKLQTASGYLTRCLSRLVYGPRMVLLWRVFHMTQVRYHMRRIASISDEVTCKAKAMKGKATALKEGFNEAEMARRVGELVRRVRLAVLGVRFGIDYSVGDDAIQFRKRFIKLWAQVGATALYAAAVMAHACQFVDNSLLDTLLSGWIDINHSEGMFAIPENRHDSDIPSTDQAINQRRMIQFREVVKQPLDRMLICGRASNDIGG